MKKNLMNETAIKAAMDAGIFSAELGKKMMKAARARANRKAREAAYRDCGMVKVRGALGGTYWE
ncbi:MAG: hypothetical protein WC374_13265 [Phycisphaerae bacterium]|jgi:hypothetical protein